MTTTATKKFDVEAGSTPALYYQILVRFRGQIIENILSKTMQEAYAELARRGYEIDTRPFGF